MASRTTRSLAGLDRVGSREADDLLSAAGVKGHLVLRGGPVRQLPPHIRVAAISALSEPDRRPSRGLPELREAIAGVLHADVGEAVDFVSAASFRDDSERVVTVRSLSKACALASWRMGYVLAAAELTEAFAKVFEWECLHCAYVPQRVATAAIAGPQDWLAGVNDEYQGIRDRLITALSGSEWLACVEPAAGPFLFLNMLRAEAATGADGYAQLLELGIHTVPGAYFHAPGYVRLPFGADPDTVSRLAALLEGFTPNEGRRRGA